MAEEEQEKSKTTIQANNQKTLEDSYLLCLSMKSMVQPLQLFLQDFGNILPSGGLSTKFSLAIFVISALFIVSFNPKTSYLRRYSGTLKAISKIRKLKDITYTANVYIDLHFTGCYRIFLHHRETLYSSKGKIVYVVGNPVIFTDWGENPMITIVFAICKYYWDSLQHTQSFPLRSIRFLCESYCPFS